MIEKAKRISRQTKASIDTSTHFSVIFYNWQKANQQGFREPRSTIKKLDLTY